MGAAGRGVPSVPGGRGASLGEPLPQGGGCDCLGGALPLPYGSCAGLRGFGRTPAEGTLGGSGVCPARAGRGSASAGAAAISGPPGRVIRSLPHSAGAGARTAPPSARVGGDFTVGVG